jgi:hypothetical protein
MIDQSPKAHEFLDKHILANANLLIKQLLTINDFEQDWYQELFCKYEEPESSLENDYCSEDPQLIEPYEFYIVSDYFAYKLKEHNELLTNQYGFWIWGRTTTGQSIILDYVFQRIWENFNQS